MTMIDRIDYFPQRDKSKKKPDTTEWQELKKNKTRQDADKTVRDKKKLPSEKQKGDAGE
jgi:hypothetical protein